MRRESSDHKLAASVFVLKLVIITVKTQTDIWNSLNSTSGTELVRDNSGPVIINFHQVHLNKQTLHHSPFKWVSDATFALFGEARFAYDVF